MTPLRVRERDEKERKDVIDEKSTRGKQRNVKTGKEGKEDRKHGGKQAIGKNRERKQ